jgi:rhamnosyltransferase
MDLSVVTIRSIQKITFRSRGSNIMNIVECSSVQHVFVIGSKCIGQYGGFETFIDKLTECQQNLTTIKYHIACKANGNAYMDESKLLDVSNVVKNKNEEVIEFTYHNAHVFKLHCPKIGSAAAIYYDISALKYSIEYCRKRRIDYPYFYILTCRIGPFIWRYKRQIEMMRGKLFVNPDGHEWMRAKWSTIIKKYWKYSESLMVKYADILVCDSINIEKYILKEYCKYQPKTTFIPYGADTHPSTVSDDDPMLSNWLKEKGLKTGEYYLVVGRFVPENNYEVMIREFLKSKSKRSFALITNINDKYLAELEKKLHYSSDARIKFVGTVYNTELLKKIRECAYGYFHGHEVGGTNPSLLEALASTDLNLILDVDFNREVGRDTVIYWSKTDNELAKAIDLADIMNNEEKKALGAAAKKWINKSYSWNNVSNKYIELFLPQKDGKNYAFS